MENVLLDGYPEIIKEFFQDSICSVCQGVVRLPAVMCVECNTSICSQTCFEGLKGKCPQRCAIPLYLDL